MKLSESSKFVHYTFEVIFNINWMLLLLENNINK